VGDDSLRANYEIGICFCAIKYFKSKFKPKGHVVKHLKYAGQVTMGKVLILFVIEFCVVMVFLILLKKYVFVSKKRQNQNNIKNKKR
jgi:hypothetical protein